MEYSRNETDNRVPVKKTKSKDVARLMAAMGLLVFSVGVFGFLLFRFGPNPYAHKNSVSLAQLLGGEQKVEEKNESGQVAGAADEATFSVETMSISNVKSGDKTIEMVLHNSGLLMRYNKKIYTPQTGYVVQEAAIEDADFYPWKPVVTIDKANSSNPVTSFLATQDTKKVLFVVQNGTQHTAYFYNEYNTKAPLTKIHTFTEAKGQPSVPRATGMSPNGTYVSFAMFECVECGDEVPVTMVVNLENGKHKMVGKTSYMNMLDNGTYQFKDYMEVDCPDPTSATKCAIDPQFLQLREGKL